MFAKGENSITIDEILDKVSEESILFYYLGITKIPCLINSPFRKDNKPSFGIWSPDGYTIAYTDFSTKEQGNLYQLLGQLWELSYRELLLKIYNDIPKMTTKNSNINTCKSQSRKYKQSLINRYYSSLECKTRDWEKHDIEYWGSYGITIKWLKYAEVYPISHTIIIKENKRYVFKADKYAYAYVERKEKNVTLKIYQPFNDKGYKWSNKHDKSVISLWTKLPAYNDIVCICASLKDALCLWANTGIPSIAIQGEGYGISDTAINELKEDLNIYLYV